MSTKKKKSSAELESIRLDRRVLDKVREVKKVSRIPIKAFLEMAAMEKVSRYMNGDK